MHLVLIPGAGGAGWYWHRVVPLLEDAGHTAVALELPADDPDAGLPEYVEIVLSACAYEEVYFLHDLDPDVLATSPPQREEVAAVLV